MKTEKMLAYDADASPSRIETMLAGTIFTSEFAGAAFGVGIASENAVDAPQATQQKTCKPTRNPCCRPSEAQGSAPQHRDAFDLLSV